MWWAFFLTSSYYLHNDGICVYVMSVSFYTMQCLFIVCVVMFITNNCDCRMMK